MLVTHNFFIENIIVGTPEIIVDDESKDWETAQQMPDLLKTGDLRVEAEQAFGNIDGNISDEDSWPSESSEGFGEEPSITPSSQPVPSKYTNREDVVSITVTFFPDISSPLL